MAASLGILRPTESSLPRCKPQGAAPVPLFAKDHKGYYLGYANSVLRLHVGGGNARKTDFELPAQVRVVSNTAGITGGVRLLEPQLDELFGCEPMAQMQTDEGLR